MSLERPISFRDKLINDYRIVFESYPELRESALEYWKNLPGKNLRQEHKLFDQVALKISDQLLDNPLFLTAMEQAGKDPIECAIIESFFIIDTVLDV